MKEPMKKLVGGLIAAALVIAASGCNTGKEKSGSDSGNSSISDNNSSVSDNSSSVSDDTSGGIGGKDDPISGKKEYVKDGLIWEVLPKIEVTPQSEFRYIYSNALGGVKVTGYTGKSTAIRIPDEFDGKPVVNVDLGDCYKTMTEIILPDTVKDFTLSKTTAKSIKYINHPRDKKAVSFTKYDDYDNRYISIPYSVEAVYIPDCATEIQDHAFAGCKNLTNITIPESVTKIGAEAFVDTPWLAQKRKENPLVVVNNLLVDGQTCSGDVVIPNGVTAVCDYAFRVNRSITSVTIPEGVTLISDDAFAICESLASINIPDSVKEIGTSAFYNTPWLKNKRTENPLVIVNNILIDGRECSGDVTVPDGITLICGDAFRINSDLTSIKLPDSVTKIGDSAFSECDEMTSINIPDGVTEIGNGAFYRCESLTSLKLPDSVNKIGYRAFSYCTKLVSMDIPKGVTEIGYITFANCQSLTSVTIPGSVTKIGGDAFSLCHSLESITIPDSVVEIGDSAFCRCEKLANVTIPDSVIEIGSQAFFDTPWLESKRQENPLVVINNILLDGKACSGDVTIPDGVTKITDFTFMNCNDLTSVTIPDSVTAIGGAAFGGCSNLTSVTIPNGVTKIGDDAFFYCDNLANVNLPDGLTEIGAHAFSYCPSLKSIDIPKSVTVIDDYAFSTCKNLTSIDIPESVTRIGIGAFNYCDSLTSVTVRNKDAEIDAIAFSDTPWLQNKREENPIVILNNTVIDGEFCNWNVTIPDGVTKIGDYAFADSSITGITIPGSVTVIGKSAFSRCPNLISADIADGLKEIDDYAFSLCPSLTSINIPDGVTRIGNGAFTDCTSLTNITIPDSVTDIGYAAFLDSPNIKATYKGKTYTYDNISELYTE